MHLFDVIYLGIKKKEVFIAECLLLGYRQITNNIKVELYLCILEDKYSYRRESKYFQSIKRCIKCLYNRRYFYNGTIKNKL